MERRGFNLQELFVGDWETFKNYVICRDNNYFFDADGVIVDLPRKVLNNFQEITGVSANAHQIDRWNYLTHVSEQHGLSKHHIEQAENGWYDPVVLSQAPKYLYMEPLIRYLISQVGPDNVHILTSRKSELHQVTHDWFKERFNDLIPRKNIIFEKQKDEVILEASMNNSKVIFFDDQDRFIKPVLQRRISNCLCIHTPLGVMEPLEPQPGLITVRRFPHELQAQYPLLAMFKKVWSGAQ